jgi:CBS domain-containing membrane protein
MNLTQFIRLFTLDPVNLSIKGKLLAVVFCFSAILITALITQFFMGATHNPILIASMGASAIILFIIPNSPLAQPWPFAGGQMISALVGITCAQMIPDTVLAATAATGLSVLFMLLLRCLHPPAAATALTPVMSGHAIVSLGYSYALIPIGINVLVMLTMAIIINRWLMGYNYPVLAKPEPKKTLPSQLLPTVSQSIGVSEQDMIQALQQNDVFLDITAAELSKVLTAAELYSFKRLTKTITCADIMVKNVMSVEYGTEVEDAWKLMLKHNLKAIPVIDRARRVIGMITWHDFFKFIDLHPYQSLAERFRNFVHRTPDVSTTKPEAVGHLMATTVTVCSETAHIAELIPLMANNGHRQIPVVNHERRLVGIVYQADLIAALYNQLLAHRQN